MADFAFYVWRKERHECRAVVTVRHHLLAVMARHLAARQLFLRLLTLLAPIGGSCGANFSLQTLMKYLIYTGCLF